MKRLLTFALAVMGTVFALDACATAEPNAKVLLVVPDGEVVPCLAISANSPLNPEIAAIVQGAVAQGKPVAAQTSSVIMLGKAGVLSGKKYAYVVELAGDESYVEGAEYAGSGIVQDGKIITSGVCPFAARGRGLPDGTKGLVEALIAELSS